MSGITSAMIRRGCRSFYLVPTVCFLLWSTALSAQLQLLENRWHQLETEHFILISQLSSRQTERFADELETWRRVAAAVIIEGPAFPAAPVPNYVYLFDTQEDFSHFAYGDETAFFYPTPRANFMAMIATDADSVSVGFHHYTHFLMRNFLDLRLPRWYEEGLAAYLGRVEITGGRARLQRFTAEDHEAMASLGESLSMDRLLFRDDALASPRLIQIANLKSESFLHYLWHGPEDGFPDRREQLGGYLDLLLEGRNPRFAYDMSFDVTTEELDAEFHNYLLTSARPRGEIQHGEIAANSDYQGVSVERPDLTVLLGELALNAGQAEAAQAYFQAGIDGGSPQARSYSGLGDALRFQELEGMDQTIAGYFEQARDMAPEDPFILLDYGEYWEVELSNCERIYPEVQRSRMLADVREHFQRAQTLIPDHPEVHLAMAQLSLFPGEDWRDGVEYQQRAFELLPADSFIMEQSAKYAIASGDFDHAERLIGEMAQPIHFFGEPDYVSALRERLSSQRRGEAYDACAE